MKAIGNEIIGQVFGRLTVLYVAETKGQRGEAMVRCLCECGNEKTIMVQSLRRRDAKRTVSCGCRRAEVMEKARFKHGHFLGKKATREYRSWRDLIQRCTNPKVKSYEHYGGRGITFCSRWLDFRNFIEDMGQCPAGYQLDRINNEFGYSKENCRWTTKEVQMANRRCTHWIELNGVSKPLLVWAKEFGLNQSTVSLRFKRGVPVSELFLPPQKGPNADRSHNRML